MYNPYANQGGHTGGNPYGEGQNNNANTPSGFSGYPQAPVGHNGQTPNMGLNQMFGDPAAQMGLQFGQSAFNASQAYMKQNIEQFVGSDADIKYYFKVSNSYVLRKIGLILFPFRNKTWLRQVQPGNSGAAESDQFATPFDDVNAPDLYIPTMALLTYIVTWALTEGIKGDFHPEMLGYATTRTLAFYLLDVVFAKVAFYALGTTSKAAKVCDIASYSGYKFVPILVLILLHNITSSIIIKYLFLFALVFSLGFFLMRSLRYVVLPSGLNDQLSTASKRMRTQFLFIYAFVIQGVFIWLLT